MKKPALSVLLIAKDEAARLPLFFASLKKFRLPLEVVLLDSGSTDGTPLLARRQGARVLTVEWEGFGATKNRGIRACRADWILSLDADENPDEVFCRSVEAALQLGGAATWLANRLNYFLGKPVWHGGWHPDRQLRLFRKGTAQFNLRPVHEGMVPAPGQPAPGRLDGLLHHHSYPSLDSYLQRLNRYTGLQAEELLQRRGARPATAALRLVLDPPLTFAKMLFLKAGLLDGKEGCLIAALSAFSTFWKYAKWWHLSWKARGGHEGQPWVTRP
jgi:hypothetical protein